MIKKLILLFTLFLTPAFANSFDIEPATISLEGDTLHYVGDIDPINLEKFNNFIEGIDKTKLKTFKINSQGGEIMAGMEMARFVHKYKLDVEVYKMCFSSCANYIFMAGNEKRIHPDTILGWHGDATSSNSLQDPNEIKQDLHKQLSKYITDIDELAETTDREYKKLYIVQPAKEAKFYQELGIDNTAIRYGHISKQIFKELEKGNYVGWTFSPEIMEQLNITNVKLVTGQWKPATRDDGKLLYIDKLK